MKLLRLITKNFKKLGDFSADFTDGLNVIVGDNAQGKSTLLQAIEAALFGVTVVPGKKENIPTWGQAKFSLELTFTNHVASSPADDHYMVLTRTGTTAKLERFGPGEEVLLANGNTPVTKYIEELTGLTAKDFNLFIQSKQHETAGLLTFGATALNNKVEEFAGISLIDQVNSRAREMAQREKAKAEASAVDPHTLQDAQDDVQGAKDHLQQRQADQAARAAAVATLALCTAVAPAVSSDDLSKTARAAARAESALREAQTSLTHNLAAVKSAEQAQQEAGAAVDADELNLALKATVASLKLKKKELAAAVEALANAKLLQDRLEQAQKTLAEAAPVEAADLLQAQLAAKVSAAELEANRGRQAAAAAALENLQKMEEGAACPTCGNALTDHDPEVLAKEIEQAAAALKSALDVVEVSDKASTSRAKVLAQLVAQGENHAALQAIVVKRRADAVSAETFIQLERTAQALPAQVDALSQAVATQEAAVASAEETNGRHRTAALRLKKAESELELAKTLVNDCQGALVPNPPTDADIEAAARAETAYRAAVSAHTEVKQRLAHDLHLAEVNLKQAVYGLTMTETTLQALATRAATARVAAEAASKASRLARFLSDRRQSYLKDVWETVLAAASRQVKTASGGMITRITNAEGEFGFEEDGVVAPVASASGAQKAFIGAAIRVGLARALYGADSLLIFDEPTESMREHHATALVATLASAARQMLLITHREQDQALATNIIQVGV